MQAEATNRAGERLLVPIDGSANSDRVIDHLVSEHAAGRGAELQLINVQIPLDTAHAQLLVSAEAIQAWHRDEGDQALRSARAKLDAAGIPYAWQVAVGRIAETIVQAARERRCDRIVMGTHGRGALTHLLLGSVASAVLRTAGVPVTMIR